MAPPLYSQYPGDAATKRDVNGALQEASGDQINPKRKLSTYYKKQILFCNSLILVRGLLQSGNSSINT